MYDTSDYERLMEASGLAVIWLDSELRELRRTRTAGGLLEHYFGDDTALPSILSEPLLGATAEPPALRHVRGLSCLHVHYTLLPEHHAWALSLRTSGLDRELEHRLTPRLSEIAAALLHGMTNEEIARRDQRALATIKQQVSELYGRLGVDGRRGLIRLAAGMS